MKRAEEINNENFHGFFSLPAYFSANFLFGCIARVRGRTSERERKQEGKKQK